MVAGKTSVEQPGLQELQHWTWVLGRGQQMLLEKGFDLTNVIPDPEDADPLAPMRAGADFWSDTVKLWQHFLDPEVAPPETSDARGDRRFAAPQWQEQPVFDFIRRSYLLVANHLLKGLDAIDYVDPKQKRKLRFATQGLVDALSPSNFPTTNPQVLERIVETRGENLLRGLQHMLADLERGQVTHVDPEAFRVGHNIATTPGKVIKRTPLYELIQYTPVTEQVETIPLVIFPPWINRFYILDLTPEKSLIRWAVAQGLTVFVVSWKSADASMKDVSWDNYIEDCMLDAIETVRGLLKVPSVHALGYCVAGTTLAAALAVLAARGQADKVTSATFLTAQVDFADAGELNLFVDDDQLTFVRALSSEGYMDGRYMAATFNLLRGRDLIWSYVTNNYLLGEEYAPFELLHWNSDVTNLPATWHQRYLADLYRDNRLVLPGSLSVCDTPIDLGTVTTPSYVQAGRDDHIAPAVSVWKITRHFNGPVRFVLAGSGHIAGVVNPPESGKYQYWTGDSKAPSLDAFVEGATETKGSWWPDWRDWLRGHDDTLVPATGARVPGKGKLKAVCDAPGEYVLKR